MKQESHCADDDGPLTITVTFTLNSQDRSRLEAEVESAFRRAMSRHQQPPVPPTRPPTLNPDVLLLNSRQTAKLLGISERSLWSWCKSGRVPPPIRLGGTKRWSLEQLKRWIAAGGPRCAEQVDDPRRQT